MPAPLRRSIRFRWSADKSIRQASSSAAPAVSTRPAVYRKVALYVGRWHTDSGVWDVTPHILSRIVANFDAMKQRGQTIPMVWDHTNSARARFGDVTSVATDGRQLIIHLRTQSPDAIARLGRENQEVSVEVTEGWQDGHGNVYDYALTHVAVVNHPVVTPQPPFVRVASRSSVVSKRQARKASSMNQQNRSRRLAEGDPPTDPPADGGSSSGPITAADDATEISVAEVVNLLNQYAGMSIAADVDTVKELRVVLESLVATPSETPADPPPPPDMPADMPAAMVEMNRKLVGQVRFLQQQIDAVQRQNAEERFGSELDRLAETGRINAAMRASIVKVASTVRYDLSILKPYQELPEAAAVPTRRRAGIGATGAAPLDEQSHRKAAYDHGMKLAGFAEKPPASVK